MKLSKERLKTGFIKHRTYLSKGMSEIYAFRAIVMFVSASGLFMEYVIKFKLPIWLYASVGFLMAIGCWTLGYYWDKCHLYDTESDFGNQRNPAIRKLLRRK